MRCEVSSIDNTCRLTRRPIDQAIHNGLDDTLTTLILSNDGLDDAEQDKYSDSVSNDSETESEMIPPCSTDLSTSEYWRRNSMRPRRVNHKMETQIFQHLAEALRSNMTISSLHVSLIEIKLEGIKYLTNALQNNTTMTTLMLIENNIQNEGVQHLAYALERNYTLTKLTLQNNDVGDEGIEYLSIALEKNTTLTALDLGNNNITNQGASHLAKALRKNRTLTSLDLRVGLIDADGAKSLSMAIKENKTLQELWIRYNDISYAVSQQISQQDNRYHA
ncbi:unnamed protein product [Rotaria sordida]|uniref:Uncharacterized protein n=1 Tax=Rotaria sordida TaxID=392033 RepID=A0A819T705_9BILA|nr:unnamed protein product [Rotaria sordida]